MSAADYTSSKLHRRNSDALVEQPELGVSRAIERINQLLADRNKFENHRIRMLARQVDGAGSGGTTFHKAIVYTSDATNEQGALTQRLCFRVELYNGKPRFLQAASSAEATIHQQICEREERMFAGAPFHWFMLKNTVKPGGATNVEPMQFLTAVMDNVSGARGPPPPEEEFMRRIWVEALRLKETRQMMDKVKYVKDWGDLTQTVVVQISVNTAKLEARIKEAKEELNASTPRSRRGSNSSAAGSEFSDISTASSAALGAGGRRGSDPHGGRRMAKLQLPRTGSHGSRGIETSLNAIPSGELPGSPGSAAGGGGLAEAVSPGSRSSGSPGGLSLGLPPDASPADDPLRSPGSGYVPSLLAGSRGSPTSPPVPFGLPRRVRFGAPRRGGPEGGADWGRGEREPGPRGPACGAAAAGLRGHRADAVGRGGAHHRRQGAAGQPEGPAPLRLPRRRLRHAQARPLPLRLLRLPLPPLPPPQVAPAARLAARRPALGLAREQRRAEPGERERHLRPLPRLLLRLRRPGVSRPAAGRRRSSARAVKRSAAALDRTTYEIKIKLISLL